MKGTWEAPRIMVQEFEANEYVAACGDSGTVYKFQCNAGSEGKRYDVTTGKDGSGNLTENPRWDVTNYYHPCNETHEAESNSGFINGYLWDNNGSDRFRGTPTPVIIWTDNGRDVHCTTNLDMSSWETAKS